MSSKTKLCDCKQCHICDLQGTAIPLPKPIDPPAPTMSGAEYLAQTDGIRQPKRKQKPPVDIQGNEPSLFDGV